MKHMFCVLVLTFAPLAFPAAAQTTVFGSIYNFDAYNNTGQDTHGFQVELDGLTPQQAYYNFSATRYGAPTVLPFAGGVYIRYDYALPRAGMKTRVPRIADVLTANRVTRRSGNQHGCDIDVRESVKQHERMHKRKLRKLGMDEQAVKQWLKEY